MQPAPVLFVYRLPFEGKPPPYELIRSLTRLQAALAAFCAVFTAHDHVAFAIEVPNVALPGFIIHDAVEDWVRAEAVSHPTPPKIDVLTVGAALPTHSTVIELQATEVPNAQRLFEIYRNASPAGLSAYEFEGATDLYDPLFVSLARSFGSSSFGSSEPRMFLDKAVYLTDPVRQIGSVLDAGCGAGYLFEMLKRVAVLQGCRLPLYAGIDAGRSQVLRAQQRYPRAFFRVGDVADLEYTDGAFDIVCAYSVLQFLPQKRILRALREILRVARRGAFVTLLCENSDHKVGCGGQFQRKMLGQDVPTIVSMADYGDVVTILEASGSVTWQAEEILFKRNEDGVVTQIPDDNPDYLISLENALESMTDDRSPGARVICPSEGSTVWQATSVEITPVDFEDRSNDFAGTEFGAPIYYRSTVFDAKKID